MFDPIKYEPIPPALRVSCPDGYDPVVDLVCNEVAFYVERFERVDIYIHQLRKIWPNGVPVSPDDWRLHCGSCGRHPDRGIFQEMGIRRDEQGVRRLW